VKGHIYMYSYIPPLPTSSSTSHQEPYLYVGNEGGVGRLPPVNSAWRREEEEEGGGGGGGGESPGSLRSTLPMPTGGE